MPASYDEKERIYHKGFRDGWVAGQNHGIARPYYEPKVDKERMEAARSKTSPKKAKRTRAKDPRLSKAMKAAYAKSHKKNGDWKKGWNRSKMFKEAHRLKRGM